MCVATIYLPHGERTMCVSASSNIFHTENNTAYLTGRSDLCGSL